MEKVSEAELEARALSLAKKTIHDDDYYYHQRLHDAHMFEIMAEKFNDTEYKLLKGYDFFTQIHSLNRDYLVKSLGNHIYLLALARIYKFSIDETLLKPLKPLPNFT